MTDTTTGTVRPFADVLHDLGRGQVSDEASVALTDLVQAVMETGKKGAITLKVEVEPFKGSTSTLLATARIDSRLPQGDPVAAVFFPDDRGNLHRNDPRQGELPIREVARADADLREAK